VEEEEAAGWRAAATRPGRGLAAAGVPESRIRGEDAEEIEGSMATSGGCGVEKRRPEAGPAGFPGKRRRGWRGSDELEHSRSFIGEQQLVRRRRSMGDETKGGR